MSIARKTDPQLWETAKRRACRDAALCLHSARKMQWATRWYKAHGGRYVGRRSPQNRLARWTRQRWRTSSGRRSDGRRRYLPDAAWRALSPDEIRRTNAAKRSGHRRGRQYVRQPADVARKTRAARESPARRSRRRSRR